MASPEAGCALASIERALGELGPAAVAVRPQERGGWTFLSVVAGPDGDAAGARRRALAEGVADFIVQTYQPRLLRRLVSSRHSYFAPAEQRDILARAARALNARSGRERVLARLADYLEHEAMLIVDGFVTFRLQDMVAEAEEAVDGAVDAFLLQREYQEFIALLRHFVDTLPPRHDLVHAVLQPGGRLRLVDADGHALAGAGETDPALGDLAPEDRVISALIPLAPRSVILHQPARSGALAADGVAAIRDVFGARLHLCDGCRICRQGSAARSPRSQGS